MDGDEVGASVFNDFGEFDAFVVVFPAGAHFDGKRHGDRGFHLFDDFDGTFRFLHECGAVEVGGEFVDGAAHVDVDAFWGVLFFDDACGFCHGVRVCAKNLLNDWTFSGMDFCHAEGFVVSSDNSFT